uniref:Uncharacterized protein n=1 Tax=Aeromonas caviae TaxID=648 RepID=A0A6M4NQH0_AERCA|nr:Hypothetical protein [Aeromonas caviae]QMV81528.1 Hypothetical protein [Aeromonas caviae]
MKKGRKALAVAVADFIHELRTTGFDNLKGRNKPSWIVPRGADVSQEDLDHAKAHNLHHYHIGFPRYEKARFGGMTSAVILHYQLLKDGKGHHVYIVGTDKHPPFRLPLLVRLKVR